MTARKTSFAGLMGWCFCVTFCLVVFVAAAWKMRPDWFSSNSSLLPPKAPAPPIQNPAELISNIDSRLTIEQQRLSELKQSAARLTNLKDSLDSQIAEMKTVAADRQQELLRYGELVNADEGIILANGEYVSESEVRDRASLRRSEFIAHADRISKASDLSRNAAASLASIQSSISTSQRGIADLKMLRNDLAAKLEMFGRLESQASVEESQQPTLRDLQRSVERTQDMLDIRLQLLDEVSDFDFGRDSPPQPTIE